MKSKLVDILKSFFRSGDSHSEKARQSLQKNLLNEKDQQMNKKNNSAIRAKNQSMQDSQGVNDHSGSSYKGPGNVDREKTHSNMGQRNF